MKFGQGFSRQEFETSLNRMSKWLVSFSFALFVLWKHDVEVMWMVMGSTANSLLSFILKKTLNHHRPDSTLRSDPGMPSSHAQSIFYIVVFALSSLFHSSGIDAWTISVAIFALSCGSYLTWLRVSGRLHTVGQVVVGAVIGFVFGASWFWLWCAFVLEAFISSLWVKIALVIGTATFCVFFLIFVTRWMATG